MPRIAVAEDDPHLRQLVTLALGRRGHEVVAFSNGAEALEVVTRGGFDLVISDVKMPRLDGIELCRGLRARFDKAELPLILCSVLDEEDDILRGYEAGANEYLVKPFRPSVLQAKVAQLLHERPTSGGAKGALPLVGGGGGVDRFPARFDAYTLLRRIGEGGMGAVYEARKDGEARSVALKLLSVELAEDRVQLARYFREIATLTWVECPHVVRIVDAGFSVGRYFLCMELVPGRTALQLLRDQGPLRVPDVLQVGADLCRAIDALLEKGLVHRDIKPGNVVIGDDRRAVLIDFGLAKSRTEEALTSTSEILGTAEYMAPEVVKGQVPDVVSDLYSLGATLYELLTDERPTPGRNPTEIFNNILNDWIAPRVDERRRDCPPELVGLVADLLDPEPARRPQDPIVLGSKLEAMLRLGM
ncbi:MAG: protein kinase [Planctomycetes bacterium]|nr:protein kinase [Planctomycetota bacterium]